MLLQPSIVNKIINGIIAPHGMTDLIHAQQNNYVNELYKINLLSIGSSLISHQCMPQILNSMFFLSSIIHFRHDMPKIKNIPRYLLSIIVIFGLFLFEPNFFLVYMCFLHVPNHYKLSWFFLKKEKIRSLITILVSTFLFLKGGNLFNLNLQHHLALSVVKSLVISHIIYEECFIHLSKEQRNKLKKEFTYTPIQYHI